MYLVAPWWKTVDASDSRKNYNCGPRTSGYQFHFSLLLQLFCSLCFDSSRARGWRQTLCRQIKAFYIIMAILIVLFLRLLWSFIIAFTFIWLQNIECAVILLGCWLNFPSSFVLPLLFLHRAGTLACSKNTNKEDKS